MEYDNGNPDGPMNPDHVPWFILILIVVALLGVYFA